LPVCREDTGVAKKPVLADFDVSERRTLIDSKRGLLHLGVVERLRFCAGGVVANRSVKTFD
jgi:hypothetical protein